MKFVAALVLLSSFATAGADTIDKRDIRNVPDNAVEYHRLPDGRILPCYVVGTYSNGKGGNVRTKSCDWANAKRR